MEINNNEKEESSQENDAGTEEAAKNSNIGKPTEAEEEIVTKAKEAAESQIEAEKLKAANLEKEDALLKRKEALAQLGGGSPAGDRPAVSKQTAEEYSKEVMSGKTPQ